MGSLVPLCPYGDNVPMPRPGLGGSWWGRDAGNGWSCESAVKQQP